MAFETDIPYNPQCFVRYSKYSRIFLKCLKVLPITLVTEFKINTNSDIFNIYEINQINWDMKICCPKNNWISFEWIFKKYHAHSNYICTDLEGFASEKFKLFKLHSKISKIFKRGSFEAGKILSSSHFLRNKQPNSRQN